MEPDARRGPEAPEAQRGPAGLVISLQLLHILVYRKHAVRGPSTKVIVLADGEGKSFLFAPMRGVPSLEHVQDSPQPGNFPLLELEDKTIVVFDEWHSDESVLRMAT